jgi:hypothetical protein
MAVVSVPVREVDGVPSSTTLLAEHNSNLQICSHKDPTLVTLRFLSRTMILEASALQAAIRDCSPSQWDDNVTRSARV